MLITAIAALTFAVSEPPLHCPLSLEAINGAPAVTMEYGGAVFGTCCGGCDGPFKADPKSLMAKAIKANKTIGAFEFDPITGARIDGKKAVAYSDYKAIRYYFAVADEKKTFDAAPATYVGDIKSETAKCPVSGYDVNGEKAAVYTDYNGVRYYFCCGDCVKEFKADPKKFADKASATIKPLAVVVLKK